MTTADQVANILRQHVGRDSAIKSSEIAAELNHAIDARTIREIIADEDWEVREMLVVGIPGIGYYVASDLSEADAYHAFLSILHDRAAEKLQRFRDAAKKLGLHIAS